MRKSRQRSCQPVTNSTPQFGDFLQQQVGNPTGADSPNKKYCKFYFSCCANDGSTNSCTPQTTPARG